MQEILDGAVKFMEEDFLEHKELFESTRLRTNIRKAHLARSSSKPISFSQLRF